MKIGLFGLPASGKTVVFEALSGLKADTSGQKKNANRAVVKVPDERLSTLRDFYQPKKNVHATIEYEEVSGKSGVALSDSLLGNLRACDVIAHVVRMFDSPEVPHAKGTVNHLRDIRDINTDLVFSDLAIVESGLEKTERSLKAGKMPELLHRKEVLLKCQQLLEQDTALRTHNFSSAELELIDSYHFLTLKPLLVILNSQEGIDASSAVEKVRTLYKETPDTLVTSLCGKLEMEIAQLEEDEQVMFLEEMGLEKPALNRIIEESFKLLGLIAFFTVGKDETRAWTIRKGDTAVRAAGKIHTDLQQGFIRAEVFTFQDLVNADGSEAQVKKAGKFRLEGKDYIVQDGDILCIRFNVKKS